ncbi:response regulator [Hydrocarboniclastica marina]|uniref:Response regulator n=1 Tax=Hydrocarboniclastica marina TaxID=2259620 RepID=A0A4P7XFH2_9ALTE|nr:response regulator [Hydrocarboniclastica marina]
MVSAQESHLLGSHPRRLRILIADDSDTDRAILSAIVRNQGHDVFPVTNGIEAIEAFNKERPHLVLLDAVMPGMDGFEAAQHIKALAGEALVPIIFLTSLSDADALARCLDAGGDDFLSKPYNRTILAAKIKAFNRMRLMHETVQHQRDLIQARNDRLVREQSTARNVFDNIAHSGCLDAPNIRYLISARSIFNGDVLFASPKPAGGFHLFVGDFTGHGLPAAIGAVPLAEIFYGMTAKGFAISDILREINTKLHRILPTGLFCCAAMIDVNLHSQQIEVWNGGLPEGYLVGQHGKHTLLKSRHLPLGVLTPERFSVVCERYTLEFGERLLFFSDGLLEAARPDGDMFGLERLRNVIRNCVDPGAAFDGIVAALTGFGPDRREQDDVTLVEIVMVPEDMFLGSRPIPDIPAIGPKHWRLSYEVRNETLRDFNPIPMLLQICTEVPGLRLHSGVVFTILTELFSNALEHGILKLSSEEKHSAEGFSAYYAERERRLRSVKTDSIRFDIEHFPDDEGGQLRITVEDTGEGFDVSTLEPLSGAESRYSGRGIALLRSLCDEVHWSEAGRAVNVSYRWRRTSL